MTHIVTPWMDWAQDEIGTAEIPGDRDNPRIVHYASFTKLGAPDDETPWCASFVCAALESTGWASTRSASARSYETYGRGLSVPEYGCIAVMSRGKPGQGHVAFFTGFDDEGRLLLLGGNQRNRVCIVPYDRERAVAYRWPVLSHKMTVKQSP
jgi:uncharacterized protein (TIGR02594 family)